MWVNYLAEFDTSESISNCNELLRNEQDKIKLLCVHKIEKSSKDIKLLQFITSSSKYETLSLAKRNYKYQKPATNIPLFFF